MKIENEMLYRHESTTNITENTYISQRRRQGRLMRKRRMTKTSKIYIYDYIFLVVAIVALFGEHKATRKWN